MPDLSLATAWVDLRIRGNQIDSSIRAYRSQMQGLVDSAKTWRNFMAAGPGQRESGRAFLQSTQLNTLRTQTMASNMQAQAAAAASPEGRRLLGEQARAAKALADASNEMRKAQLIAQHGAIVGRAAHAKEQVGPALTALGVAAGAATASLFGWTQGMKANETAFGWVNALRMTIGRDLAPELAVLAVGARILANAWNSLPAPIRHTGAALLGLAGAAVVAAGAMALFRFTGRNLPGMPWGSPRGTPGGPPAPRMIPGAPGSPGGGPATPTSRLPTPGAPWSPGARPAGPNVPPAPTAPNVPPAPRGWLGRLGGWAGRVNTLLFAYEGFRRITARPGDDAYEEMKEEFASRGQWHRRLMEQRGFTIERRAEDTARPKTPGPAPRDQSWHAPLQPGVLPLQLANEARAAAANQSNRFAEVKSQPPGPPPEILAPEDVWKRTLLASTGTNSYEREQQRLDREATQNFNKTVTDLGTLVDRLLAWFN